MQPCPTAGLDDTLGECVRRKNDGQRHLEDTGHFARIWLRLKLRRDEANEGRNDEAGAGNVITDPPDDFDMVRVQADFLMSFAQRGRF
jgi:hypothetical protein